MVGGALALCFHQNWQLDVASSIPWSKRFKQLQTITCRIDVDHNIASILWWSSEGVNARVITFIGKNVANWRLQSDFSAVGSCQSVSDGVEIKATGQCKRHNSVGACYEGQCVSRPVIAFWKVTVERVDDGVSRCVCISGTFPLSDTRTACICKNGCTDGL